LDEVSAGFQGF